MLSSDNRDNNPYSVNENQYGDYWERTGCWHGWTPDCDEDSEGSDGDSDGDSNGDWSYEEDGSGSGSGSESSKEGTITTEGDDGGKTDETGSQTSDGVSSTKSRPESVPGEMSSKTAKVGGGKRGPGRPPGSGTKNPTGKSSKKGSSLMGKLKIRLGGKSQSHLKRPRGRPPKNKTMQQLYRDIGAGGKKIRPGILPQRRGPGRPKGSKTKPKPQIQLSGAPGDKPADKPSTGPTAPKKRKLSVNGDAEGVNGGAEGKGEGEEELRAFWRPPADTKPLLDTVFITDVTSNMLTITIRESTTDKGFFKPREEPQPDEPVTS